MAFILSPLISPFSKKKKDEKIQRQGSRVQLNRSALFLGPTAMGHTPTATHNLASALTSCIGLNNVCLTP